MFVEYRFTVLSREDARTSLELLCDREHVLELGPGKWGGLAREAIGSGARSYTGIDTDRILAPVPEASYVCSDVLGYLRELPDRSAVSVSTGFLDPILFDDPGYLAQLTEEIARVAPRGLHWVPPEAGLVSGELEGAGLFLAQVAPSVYRTDPLEHNA